MKRSFLIAGFGGQGVQTLGMLFGITANEAGLYSTYLPAYGGEMRGGTSNCTTTISDKFIGSPNDQITDVVIALNAPSYAKFSKKIRENGVLIYNSSLIPDGAPVDGKHVFALDLSKLVEEVGTPQSINTILFGFIIGMTKEIDVEVAKAVLEKKLGKNEKFRAINEKAFNLGYSKYKEMAAE